MNTISLEDALRSRWTLEGKIPLAGVADGAVWHRARTVATGESVVLFIVQGETALEAADAVRRAYLVDDSHLLPVREIVVLDDPRDTEAGETAEGGPTTVVEYPVPTAPPLAALLSSTSLHPETARSIIGEAASGLEAARRRGVRHQFLDSNRLFVNTRSGEVVVLGVGVEAASHPGLDRSREVASFQDTAALVALLYRALTGKTPKHGSSGLVPLPSTLVDTEIPADLDLLCDLVLNESADDVPETTRELISALEPWQSIPVTLEAYPQAGAPRHARTSAADESTSTHDAIGDSDDTVRQPVSSSALDSGPDTGIPASSATTADGDERTTAEDDPAGTETAETQPADDPVADHQATADQSAVDQAAADQAAEQARTAAADQEAARRSAEESARRSADAEAIVKELRLDQKRGSSPFPGHLDVAAPVTPTRQSTPDESTPDQSTPAQGSESTDQPASSSQDRTEARPLLAAGASAAAGAGALDSSAASPDEAGSAAPTSGSHRPLAPADGAAGAAAAQQPPQHQDDPAHPAAAQTPHQAPDGLEADTAAASPAAVPVVGRTQPVAPAHTDPIVVRGRDRPGSDPVPEESTVPYARSSLLRDVVSVAVDSDDPDTYALGHRAPEERSRQSQWIIAGAVLLTIIAAVFAVTTATSGLRDRITDPLQTEAAPTTPAATESGEAPVEPTKEPTEEPELPTPEITGVELSTEGGGDPDHTDQQDRLTDGDPATYWSTQHYASPDFGGLKDGIAIQVSFAEKSTISALTVTTALNTGGTLELRAVNEDGSLGDVLATGTFAGDGEVRLEPDEPVDADKVALYIPELPPDSNEAGRFRARIAEITAE